MGGDTVVHDAFARIHSALAKRMAATRQRRTGFAGHEVSGLRAETSHLHDAAEGMLELVSDISNRLRSAEKNLKDHEQAINGDGHMAQAFRLLNAQAQRLDALEESIPEYRREFVGDFRRLVDRHNDLISRVAELEDDAVALSPLHAVLADIEEALAIAEGDGPDAQPSGHCSGLRRAANIVRMHIKSAGGEEGTPRG